MIESSFYSTDELKNLGLKSFGKNVLISRKASIYEARNISIGNNVRVDDFVILSGSICIGNFVHISAFSALYGKFGIKIDDFSGISPRCTIFSASDDFSGDYMISPLVPPEFTNVTSGLVELGKYVQIGANSILMPGIQIREGVAVGAFSFVTKSLDSWTVYCGIPVKPLKKRSKKILDLKKEILDEQRS